MMHFRFRVRVQDDASMPVQRAPVGTSGGGDSESAQRSAGHKLSRPATRPQCQAVSSRAQDQDCFRRQQLFLHKDPSIVPDVGAVLTKPLLRHPMAAVVAAHPAAEPRKPAPPLRFFYAHFHDSLRKELDALSQSVLALDTGAHQGLLDRLLSLKERFSFLEQVYNYHSSVEDEVGRACHAQCCSLWRTAGVLDVLLAQVVYPALDSKVRNVTSAYSREHEDEVCVLGAGSLRCVLHPLQAPS